MWPGRRSLGHGNTEYMQQFVPLQKDLPAVLGVAVSAVSGHGLSGELNFRGLEPLLQFEGDWGDIYD